MLSILLNVPVLFKTYNNCLVFKNSAKFWLFDNWVKPILNRVSRLGNMYVLHVTPTTVLGVNVSMKLKDKSKEL